tara:strand:- start:7106 stop:8422 length:1317 start_codon:yes stop_codon:yes gene_type:complete
MSIHKKIEEYFFTLKNKKIDLASSSLCHLSSSSSTLGYYKLKLIRNNNNFSLHFTKAFLKFFLAIIFQKKYYLLGNNSSLNNYKNIIITWGKRENFNKSGYFEDRYFNLNSSFKKNKNLWIVIYLDSVKPKKISNNILLFIGTKKLNIINFFKIVIANLFSNIFNLKNFIHLNSSTSNFSKIFFNILMQKINFKKINKVLMPYEGQPFQNYLIKSIKQINQKISTIGYLHYAHPMQLDIFFRDGCPDKLYTHSPDQKKYIIENLRWKKNRVKLIESSRYQKNIKMQNFNNKIFFPYYISSPKKIIKNFKQFVISSKNKSLPKFKIQKHPAPYNLDKQNLFQKEIEKIIYENKIKFSKKNSFSFAIVFGLSTTPLLALEKKVKVLHIVNDKFLELFSENYWPNIEIKEMSNNCYFYRLKKYGKCIKLGNKTKNYFKNVL